MNNSDRRWYVVKTARFKESYVQLQLRETTGADTYLPMVKIPRQFLRRGIGQIEPLFPGYVFAHLDLTRQLLQLRRVHAYNSLVCFDGQPAWVEPSVIEDLRRRERGRGYVNLQPAREPFRPQESVHIVDGPFSGHIGLFVRYLDSTQRVCILLDILKPQALLELPLHAVAAVVAATAAPHP